MCRFGCPVHIATKPPGVHAVGGDSKDARTGKEVQQSAPCFTKKEIHMLWTILVIVVIVLAVIGLLAVLRGRAA